MAAVANTSSMSTAQRHALLRASASYGHPVPGSPTGAGGGVAGSGPGSFEVPVPSTDDYGPVSEPTSSNTTPPPAAPAGPAHGTAPQQKKAPSAGTKSKKPLDPMEVRTRLCVGRTIPVHWKPSIYIRRNRADWDGSASFE